ncbi:NmrA family NAD(P)-binding protein [Dactylosporangium sp. NPDC051541]|uniref:NmrA family NAD(P)-binding protein n=1 Tax=Dactylosporangium sp. NPDC051541 TaxID=3363977 RepID=UPI0037A7357B
MGEHILVVGATGRQGGAVASRLLASGTAVRALTRDRGSAAARRLAAAGAQVVAGDLHDGASLARAVAGTAAVFAVTTATDDPADEIAAGLAITRAATDAGVRVVFSSGALADRGTGVAHFDTKARIEQVVLAAGPANTVLGPAGFFEMVLLPESLAALAGGVLVDGVPADLPVPSIALEDYAAIAETALTTPDALPARRVDLATEMLTRTAMAESLAAAIGRPVTYRQLPGPAVRAAGEHWFQLVEWLSRTRPAVDPATAIALRAGRALTFADWAARQPWGDQR